MRREGGASHTPRGDLVARYVCDACGTIHYQNPKLVVGCVPEHEGRILLCRRAIEPRRGFWTVPAGFMENGETLQQAAARECKEEALADVEIGSLLTIVHVLHAQQVHVFFRAKMHTPEYGAGVEKPGSRTGPARGYTVGRYRLSEHGLHSAALPGGPGDGAGASSFHRRRPADGTAIAGRERVAPEPLEAGVPRAYAALGAWPGTSRREHGTIFSPPRRLSRGVAE